jgi:hypothetical protein
VHVSEAHIKQKYPVWCGDHGGAKLVAAGNCHISAAWQSSRLGTVLGKLPGDSLLPAYPDVRDEVTCRMETESPVSET